MRFSQHPLEERVPTSVHPIRKHLLKEKKRGVQQYRIHIPVDETFYLISTLLNVHPQTSGHWFNSKHFKTNCFVFLPVLPCLIKLNQLLKLLVQESRLSVPDERIFGPSVALPPVTFRGSLRWTDGTVFLFWLKFLKSASCRRAASRLLSNKHLLSNFIAIDLSQKSRCKF